MKTTLIKSVLFASMMAASGSLFAADNGPESRSLPFT